MEHPGTPVEFETRYEWLRPGQLIERRNACSLVIVPVAPLEYHGPHLPVGCDMINVSEAAHAVCRKLGRGVVRPVLSVGTERERPPEMIEWLGLPSGSCRLLQVLLAVPLEPPDLIGDRLWRRRRRRADIGGQGQGRQCGKGK